jgi:hypothetical protein
MQTYVENLEEKEKFFFNKKWQACPN